MRSRTSTALALILALLAPAAAALGCGFECEPAEAMVPVSVESSCHREAAADTQQGFSLTSAPHDCSAHAPLPPVLSNRTPQFSVSKPITPAALPAIAPLAVVLVSAPGTWRIDDAAPPGTAAAFITPLRL